ncbi:MAG TPA: response regulator [Gemmatimonadales bacterium]|nr:response regulator [Gemmatimonadales bacterium]
MSATDPQSAHSVLIVDDEESIREALTRFLDRLGYRVRQASTGAQALERLAEEEAHVMLADIRMPGMSGVELVPKAIAQAPDLAIIMLTAVDEPRTAVECLKHGASDYLIKPLDLEELELALGWALRRRQLEIERRELEQWLAREVAARTHALEEHTVALADVALAALAATRNWAGEPQALAALSRALGTPAATLAADLERRRA